MLKKLNVGRNIIFSVQTVVIIALFVHSFIIATFGGVFDMPGTYVRNIVLDCLCILLALLMFRSINHQYSDSKTNYYFIQLVFANTIFLYSDIICWYVNNKIEYIFINYLMNYVSYLSLMAMSHLFWRFLQNYVYGNTSFHKIINTLEIVIVVSDILFILSNIFIDKIFFVDNTGAYHRGSLYVYAFIAHVIVVCFCIVKIAISNVDLKEKIYLYSYPLLPIINSLFTINIKGPALSGVELFCSLFFLYSNIFLNKELEYSKKQMELTQANTDLTLARTNLMVSQIHPHFVSNTLGMIRSMYRTEPEKAELAMNTFIGYLQKNFSELNSTTPITFAREIEHVRQFALLEQMRWPDIRVEFDLKCTDFALPSMTLQPLVENAIRHGLMPLENGGVVTISSWESDDDYFVQVADNGVGFDVNDEPRPDDHRKHIGISNIIGRLDIMCSGKLIISSEKGVGTKALIIIPKDIGGSTPK